MSNLDQDPVIEDEQDNRSDEQPYDPESDIAGPDLMDDLKNMSTEKLEELLRRARESRMQEEANDLPPDDQQVQPGQQQEWDEEAHPDGERLIEDQPDLSLEEQIGKLLVDLADYRTKPIENEEDVEDAADIFLELNSILLDKSAKKVMQLHKGVELLLILYKKQTNLRQFIIKTLDYTLSDFAPLCARFVDLSGLPFLFSFFMFKDSNLMKKKKRSKKYMYKLTKDEITTIEKNCVSIISNLLRLTSGVTFDRVFYKFKENNFEKVDRLIEIHNSCIERVRNSSEDEEDDAYYALQQVDFIIHFLYKLNDFDLNEHFDKLLNLNDLNLDDIIQVSEAYIKTLEVDKEPKFIDEKDFRTVSQNPSESESEETAYKRQKLTE